MLFSGTVHSVFVRERKIENVFENYRKIPVTVISFFVYRTRKRKQRKKIIIVYQRVKITIMHTVLCVYSATCSAVGRNCVLDRSFRFNTCESREIFRVVYAMNDLFRRYATMTLEINTGRLFDDVVVARSITAYREDSSRGRREGWT